MPEPNVGEPCIIVCHGEAGGRERLARALQAAGRVQLAADLTQAVELLAVTAADCLIVDAPADAHTRAALGRIAAAYPTMRVLVLAGTLSFEEARALVRIGIRDVLPLPVDADACLDAVRAVLADGERGAELVRGLPIVIASGKGGSGCTAIAVHLAAALASHGTTAVLDADAPPFGTVAAAGDLDPGSSVAGLLRQRLPIEPRVLRRAAAEHTAGFAILQLWTAPAEPQEVEEAATASLDALLTVYPFVVVDMGRPVLAAQRLLLRRAGLIVAVATLDLLALRNLRQLLDLVARETGGNPRLLPLLNRCDGDESYAVEQAEAALGQPFAAALPYAPGLRRYLDQGVLMAAECQDVWTRSIMRLAHEIAGRRLDDVRGALRSPAP
jgi:pilus assembly protein CpaE